jgi:hypothetical protein
LWFPKVEITHAQLRAAAGILASQLQSRRPWGKTIQGPFSVAPCQTLISRFATFSSLHSPQLGSHRRRYQPRPPWLHGGREINEFNTISCFINGFHQLSYLDGRVCVWVACSGESGDGAAGHSRATADGRRRRLPQPPRSRPASHRGQHLRPAWPVLGASR